MEFVDEHVLVLILSMLPSFQDVANCLSCCRCFSRLRNNETLWKNSCHSLLPYHAKCSLPMTWKERCQTFGITATTDSPLVVWLQMKDRKEGFYQRSIETLVTLFNAGNKLPIRIRLGYECMYHQAWIKEGKYLYCGSNTFEWVGLGFVPGGKARKAIVLSLKPGERHEFSYSLRYRCKGNTTILEADGQNQLTGHHPGKPFQLRIRLSDWFRMLDDKGLAGLDKDKVICSNLVYLTRETQQQKICSKPQPKKAKRKTD